MLSSSMNYEGIPGFSILICHRVWEELPIDDGIVFTRPEVKVMEVVSRRGEMGKVYQCISNQLLTYKVFNSSSENIGQKCRVTLRTTRLFQEFPYFYHKFHPSPLWCGCVGSRTAVTAVCFHRIQAERVSYKPKSQCLLRGFMH